MVSCDWHEYCCSNSTAVIFDPKWIESLVKVNFILRCPWYRVVINLSTE